MRLTCAVCLLAVSGCFDTQLPPQPGPLGPGTLSGRVVVAQPGRRERVAAPNTEVFVFGSGANTYADSSGAFRLGGITRTGGRVLFRYDADRDGVFEKQRILTLEALAAGPGRDVALGEVVLGDNARLEGKVLRADVSTPRGHAGTLVYVPEGPFTATSSDDGRFVFEDLPEGSVGVSFFRSGFASRELADVQLSAGQTVTLRDVTLNVDTRTPGQRTVSGTVVTIPATDASATVVFVAADGSRSMAQTDASGAFQARLTEGVYSLNVSVTGYRTVVLSSVAVLEADRELGTIVLVAGEGQVGTPVVRDGGAIVDAGMDAGFDGGSADAGTDAGFDGGTDAGTDAGFDAGLSTAPVAIVDARQFAKVGHSSRLDGTRSYDPSDAGPLSYRWLELTDSGVALSANDSVLAGRPEFIPPALATLRYQLVVTNQRGESSPPVLSTVEVVDAPSAHVVPSMVSLRPLTSAELSAAGSSDPVGAPLSFTWSVVTGTVQLSSTTGSTIRVFATATEQAAMVRLVVANAAASATPIDIPVVVSSTVTPTATVSAPDQVVGLGDAVAVTATATSSFFGEGFTFSWAQTSGPAVTLTGLNTATLGFTAPTTPTRLTFAVNATGDAGSTGARMVEVRVEDQTPPVLLSSDPVNASGASGGWYSLTATFDEALNPASVTMSNVRLLSGTTQLSVTLRLEDQGRTIRVTPGLPLLAGTPYTLELGGVTDASPNANAFPGASLSFNARTPRFTTWSRQMGLTNATSLSYPGLAVSSTNVWLVARDSTGANLAPYAFDVNVQDGGFTRTPASSLTVLSSARRGFIVNDVPQFFITPGLVVSRVAGTQWRDHVNSNEHGLASDGTRTASFFENYGPNWVTLISPTAQGTAEQVENFQGTNWSTLNTGVGVQFFSNALSGQLQLLVMPATSAGVRALRAYLRNGTGPWVNLTNSVALPSEPRELRTAFLAGKPLICAVHVPGSGRQLSCWLWQGATWSAFADIAPGSVETIDVFTRGSITWLSYAAGGRIFVKSLEASATSLTGTTLNGPGGTPEWIIDPACTSSNPEAFATHDALYLTWEDAACSGNGNQIVRVVRVE